MPSKRRVKCLMPTSEVDFMASKKPSRTILLEILARLAPTPRSFAAAQPMILSGKRNYGVPA